MQSNNKKIPVDVILTSIILALFADTKILNLIILTALPSFSGVMAAMYGIEVLLLLFIGFIFQKGSIIKLSASQICIFILCILWYMITAAFIGDPSVPVQIFGIFTLAAFIIPGLIRINVRIFLLALLMMPAVGVFYLDRIILDSIDEEGILSMGKCYSMLVPVLANLVFLRFYFMKEKKIMRVILLPFTVINIYYLVQMTMFGSRGPVLCAILLIISFYLIEETDDNRIHLRKGRTTILAICVIVLGLLFVPILKAISVFLAGFDIQLNFIDKFLLMEERGDMSNGREYISRLAIQGFMDSPVIGNGLAQFEHNTGEVYPHNFVLQMLYDGGLVLTGCVFIPLLLAFIKKRKVITAQETICLMLLFFASVPGALFSGDLWQAVILWMFFGFVLAKRTIFENNYIN